MTSEVQEVQEMILRRRGDRGLALLSVLMLTFILMVLTTLILDLSTKEAKMTGLRHRAAQSLFIAEGGAVSARSALMALMGADPLANNVDINLQGNTINSWFSSGTGQNPFGLFDYLILDGQRFSLNSSASWSSVTFYVNWSLPYLHLKLATTGPVTNSLGTGTYTATVIITPQNLPHASCSPPGSSCPIHLLGPDMYEFLYTYSITSDGVAAEGRRRVMFSGNYSVIVRRQSFARFALFTDTHTTPGGGAIWFTNVTSFDGPVHTNGEFRFMAFPKFGTPDSGSPCDPANVQSQPLTSANNRAWFYNSGSPVELASNENVVSGVRRDAPVLPGCGADPSIFPPANFTRGVPTLPLPANAYSQKGVSVGRDPTDTSTVSNLQVRQVVPELADTTNPVPDGIYVPVTDLNNNGVSDGNEPMAGGIYVQGNLDSLTLSVSGNRAVYTLVQGGQTVTVTVDRRDANPNNWTTTVNNSAWSSPPTRTFRGVPKGWQSSSFNNAGIIYVEGSINSLGGTLGQNEQATIVASGDITITNHLVYQSPPVTTDPNSNPTNLLGVYTPGNIIIATSAPNDLNLHGVFMAGASTGGGTPSMYVANYNSGSPRGSIHIIGGIIEKYYGPFGIVSGTPPTLQNGYGRDFKYDRRMSRGFAPPYFPTTPPFEMVQGFEPLAGVKPTWRESTP